MHSQSKRPPFVKREASYKRQYQQPSLEAGRGIIPGPWSNSTMFFSRNPNHEISGSFGTDQVEEMEVDHLHDLGHLQEQQHPHRHHHQQQQQQQHQQQQQQQQQQQHQEGAQPQRYLKKYNLKAFSAVLPPSEEIKQHEVKVEKLMPMKSGLSHPPEPTEAKQGDPLYIILHVTRIKLNESTYLAASPVKISTDTVTFKIEEEKLDNVSSFQIECKKIKDMETNFDTAPYTVGFTFSAILKEDSQVTNATQERNQVIFYLAYETEVPQQVKDDVNELFHNRLGVLEGCRSSSPGPSCVATGSQQGGGQAKSPHQGEAVQEASSPCSSQLTPDSTTRKRATPRSTSMVEYQVETEDVPQANDRKVARRCLSTDFLDNNTEARTLEFEAAKHQLIAAQRRLQIHALEEALSAKQREVEETRRRIREDTSSLSSLLEAERHRCALAEEEIASFQLICERARNDLQGLRRQLERQQQLTAEKERAVLVRDEQLQQLRAQLHEARKPEQICCREMCAQTRRELDHARAELETARQEAEERRLQEEIARQRLSLMRDRLHVLDQRLLEEIKNNASLQSDYEHTQDLERLVESLRADLSGEERRYQDLEVALADERETSDQLRQSLLAREDALRSLQQERDAAIREGEDASRELQSVQQRMQQCEVNLRLAQIALDESQRSEPRDWVIDRNEITITDRELGVGAWGSVKVGRFRGSEVAVKQIHQLILSQHNRRLFEREMTIAARCRHSCLLQFIGATCDDGTPFFIAEILETDLRRFLTREGLELREIVTLSLDVARALAYLHGSKPLPIIHRDISSSNVLMWRERDIWRAKLSDYGAANFMRLSMSCNPGALLYSAPEASTAEQTPKLDVFSFGVLFCETCIRELPIPANRQEQIMRISSERCRDLVNQCVQRDPLSRPDSLALVDLLSQWRDDEVREGRQR